MDITFRQVTVINAQTVATPATAIVIAKAA
jgi:hypothetical protein